jgi:hypothetical protein
MKVISLSWVPLGEGGAEDWREGRVSSMKLAVQAFFEAVASISPSKWGMV